MLRTNEKRATLLAIAAHGQLTVPQIAAVSRPSPVAHYIPALVAQGYLRLAACPPGPAPGRTAPGGEEYRTPLRHTLHCRHA
ncbi:MAG: hypothetical protein GF320_15345 [Armatimonadia bacterium]|nr:hypothetical protein [Armatimonadia bacterium]